MRTTPRPSASDAEVIVVGGGFVGSATAVELGLRGIRTLVLERDERIPDWHPRSHQVQARSFEIFRRWGIADELRAAVPLPAEVADEAVFATSLTGTLIGSTPMYDRTGGVAGSVASGDGGFAVQWITEGVLHERARSLAPVTIVRGVDVVAVSQEADGARVELADGRSLRAAFVVGADGAGSIVRRSASIHYEGRGDIGRWLYVPFEAPALAGSDLVGLGVLYLLFQPTGMIAARWLTPTRWDMQLAGVGAGDLTDDELDARIRAAIGRDDIAFERGPAVPLRLQEQLADRYRDGRLFIAGNAAHLVPHTGGHGGNLGIGDAADIGWKLAAVLRGWGGETLLNSYEAERRPIAIQTRDAVVAAMSSTEESLRQLAKLGYANDAQRAQFTAAMDAHARRAWRANGVTLDQRYTASPVVVGNGAQAPAWRADALSPVVVAGHRAPHVPEAGGSLHDAFGEGFVLLRLDDAADDGDALVAAARRADVPLAVIERPAAGYRAAYGRSLTLVRPDGHIAWSDDRSPADAEAVVRTVSGRA